MLHLVLKVLCNLVTSCHLVIILCLVFCLSIFSVEIRVERTIFVLASGQFAKVTMATSKIHHYPQFKKGDSYELFKTELLLWAEVTDLAPAKQGPAIALFSLPKNDESMIHEKVLRELTVEKLKEDVGLKTLIAFLDKHLGKDSLEEAWCLFEDFEDYKRSDETILQYIVNYDQKYRRLEVTAGMTVPPALLAFKLLKNANLTQEEKLVIMTGMDLKKKDSLYEDAKAALKKFKGGIVSGGNSNDQAIKVKVEEAYVAGYGDGKNFRGNHWRGRSRGRARGTGRGYEQRGRGFEQRGRGFGGSSNWRDRGGQRSLNPLGKNGEPMTCAKCGCYRHTTGNCKDKSTTINPLGIDGSPMNCKACGSYRHFLNDCKDSWEHINGAMKKVHMNETVNVAYDFEENEEEEQEHVFFTDTVCLYTGNDKSAISDLGREAAGCIVLDCACTSTVCGKGWFDDYLASLDYDDHSDVIRSAGTKVFCFGGGTKLKSLGSYNVPAYVVGNRVKLNLDVVDSEIPLLFSKPSMAKAGVKIDFKNDTGCILGKDVELNSTSSGHYCLPITKPVSEENVYVVETIENIYEVYAVKICEQSSADRKKLFVKLHRQFGHATIEKLTALMKDAGVWQEEFASDIAVLENCDRCKEYRRNKPRPVVALPAARFFNEKVSMDLKKWNNKWILHMIDMWSRFTLSVFVNRKLSSCIIDKVVENWIGTFGVMRSIMTDNGGEFNNDEMRDVCSVLDVEVVTTAAESPFQNGLCEKVHSITDGMLTKLKADNPKANEKSLLKWANMARNSLQMWNGFSSHQLVFGVSPNLPNILTDNIAALDGTTSSKTFAEHLNYLHECRKAFIATEADGRIKKALRHRVRAAEEVYHYGERVFYKRENSERWMGPAKVLFQDGKVIFVRHGGVFVKVSPTRLQKCSPTSVMSGNVNESRSEETEENGNLWNVVQEDVADLQDTGEEPRNDENLEGLQVEAVNREDIPAEVPGVVRQDAERGPIEPVRRSLRSFNRETGCPMYDEVFMVTIPRNQQNNDQCKLAKDVELAKLREFDVYKEVPFNNQECISTRWLLWYKGEEVRARLVARGYEETANVQRDSPTVGRVAVRLFLTISANKRWKVKTTDIKSAFLQGQAIDREVYITPPKEAGVQSGVIWKLKKCLYGLNDAARRFYQSVVSELQRLGCSRSAYDPALFYYKVNSQICGILVSHVDDFLHAGNSAFEEEVMNKLRNRFIAGKLMESDFCYIGFKIKQNEENIVLDQSDYIVEVPAISAERLAIENKKEELTKEEYTHFRRLVGSMNWLAQGTRPDILYDLIELSMRFNNACVEDLIRAVKIARKLRDVESKIAFPALGDVSEWKLYVFTDAALGNLPDGHSSTGAYVVFAVNKSKCCPLIWKSNKIKRVVRSTLAAEALSLQEGIEEAYYVRTIMSELLNVTAPINAFVDNKSTVDAVFSTKMVDDKKLRIDIAAIKEEVENGMLQNLNWIPDKEQLANVMTKKGASGMALLSVLQTGVMPDFQ